MIKGIGIALDEEILADFCRRHRIVRLWIFGSVLRTDFRPDSDIDVLVEFAPGAHVSLSNFVGVREELSGLLGRPVDLVSRRSVDASRNYIRKQHILDSIELIYAA